MTHHQPEPVMTAEFVLDSFHYTIPSNFAKLPNSERLWNEAWEHNLKILERYKQSIRAQCAEEVGELVDCARELREIIEGVIDGDIYQFSSLTLQPLVSALAKFDKPTEEIK